LTTVTSGTPCAGQRLQFQACANAAPPATPPTPVCPHCRSFKVAWKQTAGRAEVYNHTTIHHASHEAVKPNLPYVVGVVTFPDVPGVRLVTNVTDVDPGQVHIGMPVQLWWDAIGEGMHIPRFKPASI
jgi:uncharacterized OB-fold protein